MFVINRTAVVIKPREPFITWMNCLPDAEDPAFTLEELRQDCEVFLIPDQPNQKEALKYIQSMYEDIFNNQLLSIEEDWELWPKVMDWKTFQEWFDIEIHSMVLDAVDQEIEHEEERDE